MWTTDGQTGGHVTTCDLTCGVYGLGCGVQAQMWPPEVVRKVDCQLCPRSGFRPGDHPQAAALSSGQQQEKEAGPEWSHPGGNEAPASPATTWPGTHTDQEEEHDQNPQPPDREDGPGLSCDGGRLKIWIVYKVGRF